MLGLEQLEDQRHVLVQDYRRLSEDLRYLVGLWLAKPDPPDHFAPLFAGVLVLDSAFWTGREYGRTTALSGWFCSLAR